MLLIHKVDNTIMVFEPLINYLSLTTISLSSDAKTKINIFVFLLAYEPNREKYVYSYPKYKS